MFNARPILFGVSACIAAVCAAAPTAVYSHDDDTYGRFSSGVGISSLGGELHLRYEFNDNLAARGLVAGGAASFTTFQDGFAYEYDVKLGSAGAVMDWHPFSNGFRLSAGARYNDNHIDMTITPGRDEDVPSTLLDPLNDTAIALFSPTQVTGKVDFWPVAPYAGLGYFGQIYKRLWINIDAGIYYQGEANVELTQSEAQLFTQDQTDLLARQEEQAERDLRLLAFLPMVSFSLSYRF